MPNATSRSPGQRLGSSTRSPSTASTPSKNPIRRNQGAVIEPLYLSTSQHYRDSDELEAALAYLVPTWCYTRIANPTTYYLEWVLALLESYKAGVDASCVLTASGMAAISMAVDPSPGPAEGQRKDQFRLLHPGLRRDVPALQRPAKPRNGALEVRWVCKPEKIESWAEKIDENTRFLYMEAPSNPQQSFCDMKAVADVAHKWGIPFIVDATCATPALMRPLAHGADIVVHSLTKSITDERDGRSAAP